jgi:hypothetical protein
MGVDFRHSFSCWFKLNLYLECSAVTVKIFRQFFIVGSYFESLELPRYRKWLC